MRKVTPYQRNDRYRSCGLGRDVPQAAVVVGGVNWSGSEGDGRTGGWETIIEEL